MIQRIVINAVTITLFTASALQAQARDSLADRIERLERLIEVLQVQISEQAGGGVAARSRNLVELSGMILANGYSNNGNPFMDDVPQFVLPPMIDGLPNAGASGAIRQTRLTLTTFLDNVLGGEFTGELDMDFFGGQHPSSGGRTFPNLRIRRTRLDLKWSNVSLMIGQDAPPISELNPSSLAATGFPGFSGSGNLWLWLPQARVRVEVGDQIRVGLEGAALAPSTGQKQIDPFYTGPDQSERSRRPFVQGRMIVGWGDPETGGEVSAGAHMGWFASTNDQLIENQLFAASARLFVTKYVEIRGEGFVGKGLRSLGGGGVYQNLIADGSASLETKGGWGQLNFFPLPEWEIGGGYGFDDPEDADVPVDGRMKNVTMEGHIHWRPFPLIFGVEFRRLETTYAASTFGVLTNNHINVAAGFIF